MKHPSFLISIFLFLISCSEKEKLSLEPSGFSQTETEKEYNFKVRTVYKPYVNNEDIKQEYEKWINGLN